MGVTLTLGDALLLLLSVVGIVLAVFIIVAISRMNSVLKDVGYLIKKNRVSIDKTLESLPDITGNVKDITGNVKEGFDAVTNAANTIEKQVEQSAGAIAEKAELSFGIVQVVIDLVKAGIGYFAGRKK